MIRDVGDGILHRDFTELVWMNWAVVDARPFLHYLQYLTFRDLGIRHKQIQAFNSLLISIPNGIEQNHVFHEETAANLLAF